MRAFHDIDKPTCRDRLAERRAGLQQTQPSTRVCRFYEGKLRLGHATQHRTPAARLWRTRLRIKRRIHECLPF